MAEQQYKHNGTQFHLQDVSEGRDTIERLANSRSQFEGGNAILTESVNSHARDKLTRSLKEYYAGICEALDHLNTELS